jgi:hypothetical protein
MNNRQLAHLWANKSRESARGSHFYFEGETIYSYGVHFPIARHYKGVVLFTTGSYSVSTSKHISFARSACTHLRVYHVADPTRNPSGQDVKNYQHRVEQLGLEVARARDPQFKLECLERLVNEANEFCAAFGFKTKFSLPDADTLAALKGRAKAAQVKKAKATAERNARLEAELAELIQQWLAGEPVSIPSRINKVFLRTWSTEEGKIMQTSRGACVPLEDARRAFEFVMRHRESGWHRNGDTFRVGEFQLDTVSAAGVKAGCHTIGWDEIERFAKAQGWTNATA